LRSLTTDSGSHPLGGMCTIGGKFILVEWD
jgi:hypothetical protein